jgi:hypothetical protein
VCSWARFAPYNEGNQKNNCRRTNLRAKFEFLLEILREISSKLGGTWRRRKTQFLLLYLILFFFSSLVLLMIVMTYTYFVFVCAPMRG